MKLLHNNKAGVKKKKKNQCDSEKLSVFKYLRFDLGSTNLIAPFLSKQYTAAERKSNLCASRTDPHKYTRSQDTGMKNTGAHTHPKSCDIKETQIVTSQYITMATEIQQRVNRSFVLSYEPAIASLLLGHTMIIQSDFDLI